ncbi:unnamed protein product, partial [Mesorhabditis spiculigera]
MPDHDDDLLVEGNTLTKAWLAKELETHFDEKPTITEVASLGPDTLGYMSAMRRVRLHWENPADKPQSLVIKMPSFVAATAAWKESAETKHDLEDQGKIVITMMHDCEARVYAMLSKYPEFRLSIPFVYTTLQMNTGTPIIVMEDLERGCTYDVVDGFSEKQLYAIVDELVKLHVLSFKYREVVTCGIDSGNCAPPEQFEDLVRGVADQLLKQRGDELAAIRILKKHYIDIDWFQELLKLTKNGHTVLTHGDLWAPQILWKGDKILGIVDWALCKQGGLTVDLMHVLSMSVPVKLRHEITESLLVYYHEQLNEKLEAHGIEEKITTEMIKKDWHDNMPYHATLAVFAAGMWSNSPVLKRGRDDDEARINEIMQRCKAFVEETVAAHQWE